ncbi:MAG: hypothetical protein WC600_09980 [Desulfobaccales bacterium]
MKKIKILMLVLITVLCSVANGWADIPTASFTHYPPQLPGGLIENVYTIPLTPSGDAFDFGSGGNWTLNTADFQVQLSGFMDPSYKTIGAVIISNIDLTNSTANPQSFVFAFHFPLETYPVWRSTRKESGLRATVTPPYIPFPFNDFLIGPYNQPFLQVNDSVGIGDFYILDHYYSESITGTGYLPNLPITGRPFLDETIAFTLAGNADVSITSYAYVVPLPPSAFMFGSCLLGLLGIGGLRRGVNRQ